MRKKMKARSAGASSFLSLECSELHMPFLFQLKDVSDNFTPHMLTGL